MLENLNQKLENKDILIISQIGKLNHATCNSTALVYNFDAISNAISTILRISNPKSVDAIYAKPNGILYFIEMSSMRNVINSIKINQVYASPDQKIEAIQKKFKETYFEFVEKVFESYTTIISFWGHEVTVDTDFSVHTDFFKYFMDKNVLRIGTVLLTDFTARDEVVYSLGYIMGLHKFCARRFGEMTLYNCEDFKREIAN